MEQADLKTTDVEQVELKTTKAEHKAMVDPAELKSSKAEQVELKTTKAELADLKTRTCRSEGGTGGVEDHQGGETTVELLPPPREEL